MSARRMRRPPLALTCRVAPCSPRPATGENRRRGRAAEVRGRGVVLTQLCAWFGRECDIFAGFLTRSFDTATTQSRANPQRQKFETKVRAPKFCPYSTNGSSQSSTDCDLTTFSKTTQMLPQRVRMLPGLGSRSQKDAEILEKVLLSVGIRDGSHRHGLWRLPSPPRFGANGNLGHLCYFRCKNRIFCRGLGKPTSMSWMSSPLRAQGWAKTQWTCFGESFCSSG